MTGTPSTRSPAAMSSLSLLRSGRRTTEVPSARAASTSSRLVWLLEPGSGTTACGT